MLTLVSHAKIVACSLCIMGEAHTQTERRNFCRVHTLVMPTVVAVLMVEAAVISFADCQNEFLLNVYINHPDLETWSCH